VGQARLGKQMLFGRHAESVALDALLRDVLAGQSRALVLRGEAGIGKSALLAKLSDQLGGWRVGRATGIESEMELAYSGLHQICASMLNQLHRLPAPQRQALSTVFGLSAGPAPDRFLVGLATLTLFAEISEQEPLALLVDDAHWLDKASEQILAFVARRLLAERIVLVCAARTGIGDHILKGLPELALTGLPESDARALLLANVLGPLDTAVCNQIVGESHGNPLALLELPRTWIATDLAGGFGFPAPQEVVTRIEQSYARRLAQLPAETQVIVLIAAADPLGDPLLLLEAAKLLEVDMTAVEPAQEAGLLEVAPRVRFEHPLVRSAAYGSASPENRRRAHRALAQATDDGKDPDRRAWHLACAAAGPDEQVALGLEHSASRAQARGGLAAAAAFLERAAALSPDPKERARRSLDAAEAKQLAGAPAAASALVAAAVEGPLDELEQALAMRLRGQIAMDLQHGRDAVAFLLDAARRLQALNSPLAGPTYLDALQAGSLGGRLSRDVLRQAAQMVLSAPLPEGASSELDLLVTGLATRFTAGYVDSAEPLKRALRSLYHDQPDEDDVRWPRFARRVAFDLFDDDTSRALATRSVGLARKRGALGMLPLALDFLAIVHTFEGATDPRRLPWRRGCAWEACRDVGARVGCPRRGDCPHVRRVRSRSPLQRPRAVRAGLDRGSERSLTRRFGCVSLVVARARRSGRALWQTRGCGGDRPGTVYTNAGGRNPLGSRHRSAITRAPSRRFDSRSPLPRSN